MNTDQIKKKNIEHVELIDLPTTPSDTDESIWALLRENPRVIGYVLLANCGSLMFGYDVLVQSAITALPAFTVYFGENYDGVIILPALWQGLWTAFNSVGIMIGAFSTGYLQDRFGRKATFIIGGIISALSVIMSFLSPQIAELQTRRTTLLLSKIIIGVGMGTLMVTCQTYVAEISPTKLRGILLGTYSFFVALGQLIAISLIFKRVGIMNPTAFTTPFASQWALSGCAILCGLLIPESPSYLVSKNRIKQAEASYRRLHGQNSKSQEVVQALKEIAEHEKAENNAANAASYRECFHGTNLRRTRIVLLLNSLQQCVGVALIANSTYFLIVSGMTPVQSLTISQIGVGVNMFCTLLSWFAISTVGRRVAILTSIAAASFIFVGMGIAGCWPNDTAALRFIGIAILLVGFCGSLGVQSVYPVVASEVSSVRLRSTTLGFGFFVNAFVSWIFNFTVPYMYNPDAGNLGGKVGFIFVAFSCLGFLLSWLEIPETKNKTYAELDYLFERKTKTRQF